MNASVRGSIAAARASQSSAVGRGCSRRAAHAAYRRIAASSSDDPEPGRVPARGASRRDPAGSARRGRRRVARASSRAGRTGTRGTARRRRPAATWRFASSPIPFVQVCGVNQRFRASASSAIVRAREHARRRGRRPAGRRRTHRRRARRASSANVRVISPPAIRIPGTGRPERGETRAGRSRRAAPRARARRARRAARRSIGPSRRRSSGPTVAGHPPALVEVDHDRHRVADGGPRRRDGGEPLLEPRAGRPGSSAPGSPPREGAAPTLPAPPRGRSIPHEA